MPRTGKKSGFRWLPGRRPRAGRPAGDRTIFDLLRGPHATLLAFDRPGAHHLTDPAALAAYDIAAPTLVLVRPDNYLGCVTHDPADLERYELSSLPI
jgi:hypothetical protein